MATAAKCWSSAPAKPPAQRRQSKKAAGHFQPTSKFLLFAQIARRQFLRTKKNLQINATRVCMGGLLESQVGGSVRTLKKSFLTFNSLLTSGV